MPEHRSTIVPPEPERVSGVQATTSPPPRIAPPLAIQVLDQLGDLAGALIVGYLASRRLISGELACGVIVLLLGSQSAIRRWSAARGGAGLGGAGLALLVLAGALGATHLVAGTAAAGVIVERVQR